MTTPPDQWLGLETHSGDLRIIASVDGRRVEVWFRGDDVVELKRHVDHAIAQQVAHYVPTRKSASNTD